MAPGFLHMIGCNIASFGIGHILSRVFRHFQFSPPAPTRWHDLLIISQTSEPASPVSPDGDLLWTALFERYFAAVFNLLHKTPLRPLASPIRVACGDRSQPKFKCVLRLGNSSPRHLDQVGLYQHNFRFPISVHIHHSPLRKL